MDKDTVVYIPAKSDMTITPDAREIARRAEALFAQGLGLEGSGYCAARGTREAASRLARRAGTSPVPPFTSLPPAVASCATIQSSTVL